MGALSPVAGARLCGGALDGGWGWGGDDEAGIRAFSHGFVHNIFDVNPVNTTLTNGFHSLPLFALLPWLQVFWPISPSCSCSHRCVCHPPILSHPSPSVVIRYSLSRSFPPAKKKKKGKSFSPFFLPTDSFCLLLFLTQSRNTPSPQGSIISWGALCIRHPSRNLRSAPPPPPHPQSGCVLEMSGSNSLSSNLQQEVLVSLVRDGN